VRQSRQSERARKALEALRDNLTALSRAGATSPNHLQAAADECPDAVLVTDSKARIVMVNGPAARLLGMSTRVLQTLTMWDVTHPTYQADFDVLWKEFLRAGRQRGQYGLRHQDGSVVEVAYSAAADISADRSVILLRRLD